MKLEESSDTGTGLSARVAGIKSNVKMRLTGEIAGPAVAAALKVDNTGKLLANLEGDAS